jgi:hypothetical protein
MISIWIAATAAGFSQHKRKSNSSNNNNNNNTNTNTKQQQQQLWILSVGSFRVLVV